MHVVQQEILRVLMDGCHTTGGIAAAYIMNERQSELKSVFDLQYHGLIKVFLSPSVGSQGQNMMACHYVVAKRDAHLFAEAGWTEKYLFRNEDGSIEITEA